jgi:pSer/pThr/pTyr-binding forkhead associated (FHA) protein
MVKFTALLFVNFNQSCCGFSESKEPEASSIIEASSRRSRPGIARLPTPVLQEEPSVDSSLASMLPVVITKQEAAEAPRLTIQVVESAVFEVGKLLAITPLGVEGSARCRVDGHIFAGSVGEEGGKVVNDLVLPQEDGIGRRHFVMRYSPTTKKYSLKDLGDGSGTFVRIKSPLVLKQGYIVSFSDSHLLIQLDELDPAKISVRFLEGPKVSQVFNFTSADNPVRVGRMVDCCIRFDETSLSRYQCSMSFVDNCWRLEDGDGRRGSTNGTWLFMDEFFEMYDGMAFKAGQSLFEVKLTRP